MNQEAENELIAILGWLCQDMASTSHLNRFKRALGRTDFEGTLGLDDGPIFGDAPAAVAEAPAEVETPAEEAASAEEADTGEAVAPA